MNDLRVLQYRISRLLGRIAMRAAAALTLGRMPPFVSTSALIVDGDRILVVLDPIRSEPVLPGGHLAWKENPTGALLREVREETGYAIRPERLVGVFAGAEWAGEPGVVRLVYEGTILGGRLTSSAEGEAMWLELDVLAGSSTRDAHIVQTWLAHRAGQTLPLSL